VISRRRFVAGAVSLLSLSGRGRADAKSLQISAETLRRLEETNGGRLGVAIIDLAADAPSGYRAEERFPMCSTFKFLLAAAVLQRVDRRQESLERIVAIPAKPLLGNSPLTEPHAGGAMTTADLCHAILIRSDNTAANLLLESIGGPPAITAFARSIGDTVTRLDRTETALNECRPGDARDTTSPAAMAGDLKSVLLGDVLSAAARDQLTRWMRANITGLERLRAQLPADWSTADKTGSNGEHTSNDIAVMWPPGRPPIIVAAYITQCPGPEEKRAAMLREIGQRVRELLP